ncbi:STAM-binding protein [Zootermopsis nevadensis]|uniref:STAM-binding protein-like n=1 Tax=Zootermopsis nevadensis TaxID=136037 RepID=A0A067RMR1_ZOONE|nr:STAM-binding protein [Zootermopsis nevadensis]KDR24328.1 STAM-binding protein-like [Zootermopsis nevadensis]
MDQGKYLYDKQSSPDMGITDPNGRLKMLSDFGNSIDIDSNIPPRRYYRSGMEMVRMANVYLEEGSLENAYILYMKFMTLFIEKIRHHPDFATVSVTDRAINAQKLREVLPKAEKLKTRLLEQYEQEYNRYLEEQKQRELERQKREAEEIKQHEGREFPHRVKLPAQKGHTIPGTSVVVMPPVSTDDVIYPDTLELEKPGYTPKPDSLSISVPRTVPLPNVDRSTKPASLLSPSIHSKVGLRDVIVPSRLMGKFMNLAQRNTSQNIETCGILAGTLNRGRLIVTHLLVPKQNGTADSCTTQNEEEIFDYQDQHDLITLGWIHTHPSQTAFLSSVDLHTHCSYQLMMPEALAIVCAPRYEETGFFILTPHYGLDFIAKCRQTGFHPHPTEPPLYMKAEHSKLDNAAYVEVVDLRR